MSSTIIVFSPQRWDFLYRRPQHIFSRFAAHDRIVFIEQPVYDESGTFFNAYSPVPGVQVYQPHIPVSNADFQKESIPYLKEMMHHLMEEYDDCIAWLYTPLALPLAQMLCPQMLVYDRMEEVANMHTPELFEKYERELLQSADIVLTEDHASYLSLREQHTDVHCMPNSVDALEFKPAHDRTNSHPAHRDIPGPRLGYYGAIDEHFDAELIAQLADAHPIWQIVLVGPVCRIDPGTLPQRQNIHYLGPQTYQSLPYFLAGWDICLLPFTHSAGMRHTNPSKLLEYMAAELPIISTPVAAMLKTYGEVVTYAKDALAFIAACETMLLAPAEMHQQRIERVRALLEGTSWDAAVQRIRQLIADKAKADEEECSLLTAACAASSRSSFLLEETQ